MVQCLTFRLGANVFGIDIDVAIEVLNYKRIKSVPDMPGYIPGVLKVRGAIVPVVDMRLRIGVESLPAKQRIVLVRSSVGKVGLLVDEVFGINKLDEERFRKPPVMFLGLKRKYLVGLYGEEDDIVIILSMNEMLSTDEKINLKKALQKTGQRAS